MKHRIIAWICIAALLLSLSGCSSENTDAIIIGSIHPLTGSMAYEGQALVNAQQIAVDRINEHGGINGRKLVLKTADSLGTSAGSASAAQKLVNRGAVALTGTYTSSSAQVVSRMAEKSKVPFVVTVAATDTLLTNGYKYSFRIQPSVTVFSKNFIEYFKDIKTDDMKTVALIYENSNYGTGIADYITAHIDEVGLEIVGSISYAASTSTLSSEVTKLVSLRPDVLIPIGYYSDQSMLMKEILEREIEFDTIIGVANGAFSDAKFTETFGTRVDGIFDINYRYNPNSEETEYLLTEYKARYGEDIPVCAIYGYESIMLIADALIRAEEISPEALHTALAASEYTDHVLPQGAVIFDEAGENINSAGVLIQIQDGKQVIVYPKEYAENEIISEEGK